MNVQHPFVPPSYVVQQAIGPNLVPLPAPFWIYNQPQANMYPFPPIVNVYGQPQNLNHFPPAPPPMILQQPYSNLVPPHSNVVSSHSNLAPPHSNLMQSHSNLMGPPHPSTMPPHGNMAPPHANMMPPHPNLLVAPNPNLVGAPHPNLVGTHPNLVPPHPNLMPPHPNLLPQHPNLMPPHPNLMPPHPTLVPPGAHFVPQHAMQNFPQLCGQLMQPTQENGSIVNMQVPQQGPMLMQHDSHINIFDNGQLASANNELISFGEPQQFESTSKKHVYMHGTLYNAEFLRSLASPINDSEKKQDGSDEEVYNPFDDPLPSVYGIRFYNPNYGPEGAIPKRPEFVKKQNRKPNEPEPFPNIPARHHHDRPLMPLNNNNAGELQSFEIDRTKLRNQAICLEAENAPLTKANTAAQVSPKSKGKQHRRQGRNRARGFTQSFGIVAPSKRSAQGANENANAAKNVLSIFDKN